ncbi:MAG: clostripain-related cysteine peptidase [Elusimicrobiales bacterium]|jgi:hypothetical protein
MKKIGMTNLLIPAMFLAAGARAEGSPFDNGPALKPAFIQAEKISVPAAPTSDETAAKTVKEWTIMVYMNGKNDLSNYILKDLNEMEAVGPAPNINIVTESGRLAAAAPFYLTDPATVEPPWVTPLFHVGGRDTSVQNGDSAGWEGIRRYEIVKDTDNQKINSKLLETLGKTDMGDYNHLADFAVWAKTRYPARHYMLIVWNHGDGWRSRSTDLKSMTKGISYDSQTGNGITTVQLGLALKKIGGVDLYASDACLMQMSEVVYELKDSVPLIVGSEEIEPNDGWAYDLFLDRVRKNRTGLTPEVMAAAAVGGYNQSYRVKGQDSTISAVSTGNMAAFRQLADEWAGLAMAKGEKDILKRAMAGTKEYAGMDSRDFTGFLTQVASNTGSAELKSKSKELINFIGGKIVLKNATSGAEYKTSAGLGVYLPMYGYDANYSKLAWSVDGKWDEFLQWLNP